MDTKEKRRNLRPVDRRPPQRKRPVRKERKLRDADVVYTPPKPFQRGKFLLHMVTIVAVVLAVVMGMSIFFQVENVKVSGNSKYSAWEVSEAADIEMGSNLMTVSRAQISGSIIANLPYVDTVRVGIILPDTVNIEITELDVVYSVQDADGNWWLMNDTGKLIEPVNGVTAKSYTQLLGILVEGPEAGQQAVAQEEELTTIPLTEDETDTDTDAEREPTDATETVPSQTLTVGITNAQRLQAGLTVLQALSGNSISGQVDSVNVSGLNNIELWYDERFQINLGSTEQMEYKISALQATINQMETYESGHLDLSFTNWPDKVGYTPFQ